MAASQTYEVKFPLGLTNFSAMSSPEEARDYFKPFVAFMNNSYLKFALTESPKLIHQYLDEFWTSVVLEGDKDKGSIKFTVKGKHFVLNSSVINEALKVYPDEKGSFAAPASNAQLDFFFEKIGFIGPTLASDSNKWFSSGEMDRKYVRKEWSMIFDRMLRTVFGSLNEDEDRVAVLIKEEIDKMKDERICADESREEEISTSVSLSEAGS